jgi:hypothetical protein
VEIASWSWLEGGGDFRWHLPNETRVGDADAGEDELVRGGERHEGGVLMGASFALGLHASCWVRGRLPVWQHAMGVQLVETFSLGSSCRVALGL